MTDPKPVTAEERASLTAIVDAFRGLDNEAALMPMSRGQVDALRRVLSDLARLEAETAQLRVRLGEGTLPTDPDYEARLDAQLAAKASPVRKVRARLVLEVLERPLGWREDEDVHGGFVCDVGPYECSLDQDEDEDNVARWRWRIDYQRDYENGYCATREAADIAVRAAIREHLVSSGLADTRAREALAAMSKLADGWERSAAALRSEVARGVALRQSSEEKTARSEALEACADSIVSRFFQAGVSWCCIAPHVEREGHGTEKFCASCGKHMGHYHAARTVLGNGGKP